MSFETVIESARRRGESAIGYRRAADQDSASAAYSVRLAPLHRGEITFVVNDRIVIVANG